MNRPCLTLVAGLIACGPAGPSSPGDPPDLETVTTVRISPDSVVFAVGEGRTYTVSTKNSKGAELQPDVVWQVQDTTIAQVPGGLTRSTTVTARKPGRTMLIASVDEVSDSALIVALPPDSCARRVKVSTAAGLAAAAGVAQPGDCIIVAAGVYELDAPSWAHSGTRERPITLQGTGSTTVFALGGDGGIYLRASHWRLRNIRITNGFFGVQTEGSDSVELEGLEIDHMKQAAVNFRYGTHHSTVRDSYIHDTGEETARYGEGVYIGGYAAPGSSVVDEAADNNQVLDNRFGPNVRAEAVDIAAGADSVVMTGNTLDGTGTVFESGYMNSLISVRGFGHQINDNVLSKGAPHGIVVYEGSGTFRRNRIALFDVWNYPSPLGINRAGGSATIYCDNVVTDIPPGGAAYNSPCTP